MPIASMIADIAMDMEDVQEHANDIEVDVQNKVVNDDSICVTVEALLEVSLVDAITVHAPPSMPHDAPHGSRSMEASNSTLRMAYYTKELEPL